MPGHAAEQPHSGAAKKVMGGFMCEDRVGSFSPRGPLTEPNAAPHASFPS